MGSALRKALATFLRLPATIFIALIRVYQHTLSPDHGWVRHLYPHGYCPHTPTCSEYGVLMLQTRSLPVALWLTTKRLLSCHPWTKPSDEKLKTMMERETKNY